MCIRYRAGVPYVLCYPETGARQEYLRRFKSRGNSPDFIDIFIGDWDNWMESLRKDSWGIHIEMQPHQYLLDLKDQIDRLAPLTSTLPPDPRSDVYKRQQNNRTVVHYGCISNVYL